MKEGRKMNKVEKITLGIILIVIGLIIGGNSMNIIDIDIFFDGWWTLFIIIPCFVGLFNDKDKTGNLIGFVVGLALLLACQKIINFDLIWKLTLPIILIIIGLTFIFKSTFDKQIKTKIDQINKNNSNNGQFAAFSSQDINFDGEKFTGTNLTAVFGGIKCDLRNANIDKDIVINTCSVFGGIEIYVPENVQIKTTSTSLFGAISNKAKTKEKGPIIYINGTTIFGGVEIK